MWLLWKVLQVWMTLNSQCSYSNLSKIHPWKINLSGSSKRGVGIFSRVVMFLLNIYPPQMQLVKFYMYLCLHAVILQCLFCYALAYAITANGACLHLLVPPLAIYRLFVASCITACTAQIGGRTFERKAPFATTSFKNGGGLIFKRLQY